MFKATQLSKKFNQNYALQNLNLEVNAGEIFCLLGANGAGKSTTLNLFLGFLTPSDGSASVCGFCPQSAPLEVRRRTLYIPENVALYEDLTGFENLQYLSALAGVKNRNKATLEDILDKAGLASTAFHKRTKEYSKGMRQKVGIALAIAKDAKALLLDEPTSGLDPKASVDFHNLISEQRSRGAAILMATHDLFRAKEVADRVGVMRQGKLTRVMSTDTLSANALEEIYLQEMA
ncbi:ABC transporter ATP-binding protein [Glaciecola siphonariae]|uniref:ABC transporter ATP-binding protein n=1 Tax=Glaciecola siphonariae TaxID=521012 RepID=A0ABV9LS38_9ALTE